MSVTSFCFKRQSVTKSVVSVVEAMESRCFLSASIAPAYSGIVFNDSNGDGIQKSTDYGVPGVKITAAGYMKAVLVPIPFVCTVTTDASGRFTLPDTGAFGAIHYKLISEQVPGGYRATTLKVIDNKLSDIPSTQPLNFGIVKIPTITRFNLVNADNGGVITTISEGQTINLAKLPPHLNIFASMTEGYVGSMKMSLDAKSRIEYWTPWSLFGDINGKFTPGTFTPGAHTLTAAMYSKTGGTGELLGTTTIHFNAIRNALPVIDWSMPDRYGLDTNKNGLVDMPNCPQYVNPTSYTLNLDGSKSLGDSTITKYDWTVSGNGLASPIYVTGQQPIIQVPNLGDYTVSLTVATATGQVGTVTQKVKVRDVLIVQIGDSYGSGEGNPEVKSNSIANVRWADGVSTAMTIENILAHRSTKAASSQAALKLERSDKHFSVTYINLAQSGAEIANLIDPENHTRNIASLPNELDEMKAIVGSRAIDYLSMSIGGNDAGFAKRVTDMVTHISEGTKIHIDATAKIWIFSKSGSVDISLPIDFPAMSEIKAKISDGLNKLPDLYAKLDTRIKGLNLNISQKLITEYPDSTQVGENVYVNTVSDIVSSAGVLGSANVGPVTVYLGASVPLMIDAGEAKILHDSFLMPLNQKIKSAASDYGWKYVGGIASKFTSHGYAASATWFQTMTQSMADQGPDGDVINMPINMSTPISIFGWTIGSASLTGGVVKTLSMGGLHPNELGHLAIADSIFDYIT